MSNCSSTRASDPGFRAWVHLWFCDESELEELQDSAPSEMEPYKTVLYLALLLETPDYLRDHYTPSQIGDGIYALFGFEGVWYEVFQDSVPESLRRRCLNALTTAYVTLFDPLCRDAPPFGAAEHPLGYTVFMMWDATPVSRALDFPEHHEDCMRIFKAALSCESGVCISSGLHGLGHWIGHARHHHQKELDRHLKSIIDGFVRSHPNLTPELDQYAADARDGCIM